MTVNAPGELRDRFDRALAIEVCRLFFIEEKSKLEIARTLGMSRFKVARLITAAKAQGLLRIEIAGVDDYDGGLAKRLSAALPVDEAVVVGASGTNGPRALARAAAQHLCRRLRPGDVLGIGWGSTIRNVVEALDDTIPPRPVDVVQLVGALPKTEAAFNPIELASHAATLLEGRLYPL